MESNYIANFYLNGYSNELLLNFYFGDGRFYGENLEVENIKEYLLSKLTMKKLKSDDYVINNDEKTRNAILSKYDYELFIATNKYNL